MQPATHRAAATLNHVAMTMPAHELDRSTDDILAFYGAVFGWTGARRTEEAGNPLLVRLGEGRQFLFVYGDTEATVARPMDHYGVEVATEADFDAVLERARRLQEHDARVEIVDTVITPAGDVEVLGCYVRFVLPLMVEVQHFRLAGGPSHST